jgi:ABC-type thiamin/hydroxymethylpyrimidine transport system permease subunit
MVLIGYLLIFLGFISGLAGEIMFLVVAYRRSVWWMLGGFFLPPIAIVFLVFNFKAAFKPFAIAAAGFVISLLGASLAGVELTK